MNAKQWYQPHHFTLSNKPICSVSLSFMVQEMLLSENAAMAMSPARISFSYDLPCQSDVSVPPPDRHLSRSPSSAASDFDFCVRKSSDQDSSPADELFSDGRILATEIKRRPPKTHKYSKSPPPLPPPANLDEAGAEETEASKKQSTETSIDETEEKQSKSFWRFKRSSSLNCGSGYGPSLCPLPLLSRSNSTGSASSFKRTPLSKDTNHNAKHKPHSTSSSMNYQKPPLKKSYGSQGNGVRVNPVLNVPAVNIFGLASIFSSNGRGKNKNTKK